MKKTVPLFILIGIAAFGLFYFSKDNGYDLGQSGGSSVKGSFVPEPHTDYIFTTTSTQTTGFYIVIIAVALTLLFIFRNNLKRTFR
ncbi:hypothetical protein [Flavobacterium sp.]|uniref:hypothetical protein n=1 Tax=Flavobacterium sp. TaxID=239 RepID=UPI0039E6A34B